MRHKLEALVLKPVVNHHRLATQFSAVGSAENSETIGTIRPPLSVEEQPELIGVRTLRHLDPTLYLIGAALQQSRTETI